MDYNFESLILLVGTNPLPNYVVAEYFLKNNHKLKDLFIVYSEERENQKGTFGYAKNLRELLRPRHPDIKFHLITIKDVTRADVIDINIKDELSSSRKSSYHLNYTGGTKAMGVHAYRTIERFCSDAKCDDCSFSYLDARNFKIVDDKKGYISGDLRNEIKLTLSDLLFLHGLGRSNKESNFEFTESLNKFIKLIDQDNLENFFLSYPRENFLKNDKLIIKKIQISDALRTMKASEPLLSIVLSMPENYQIFDREGRFKEPKNNDALEKAIKFIDGGWLEEYVYTTLKEEFKDCEIYKNWVIRDPEWSPNRNFEIDIAVLKGYYLVGISCTTADDIKTCKSKGFEILLRTRQMGGEEARAILITRLPDTKRDELNEELKIDTGGKDNILVLGKEDLKKGHLIEKISDFIR